MPSQAKAEALNLLSMEGAQRVFDAVIPWVDIAGRDFSKIDRMAVILSSLAETACALVATAPGEGFDEAGFTAFKTLLDCVWAQTKQEILEDGLKAPKVTQ